MSELIGEGLTRNVYNYDDKFIKKELRHVHRVDTEYNANAQELYVFNKFKEYGLEHLLGYIDLEKSNKYEVIMERLTTIDRDNQSQINYLFSLDEVSDWNNDIIDYMMWNDRMDDRDFHIQYGDLNEIYNFYCYLIEFKEYKKKKKSPIGEDFQKFIDFFENEKELNRSDINISFNDIYFNNIGIDNKRNIKILDYGS